MPIGIKAANNRSLICVTVLQNRAHTSKTSQFLFFFQIFETVPTTGLLFDKMEQ